MRYNNAANSRVSHTHGQHTAVLVSFGAHRGVNVSLLSFSIGAEMLSQRFDPTIIFWLFFSWGLYLEERNLVGLWISIRARTKLLLKDPTSLLWKARCTINKVPVCCSAHHSNVVVAHSLACGQIYKTKLSTRTLRISIRMNWYFWWPQKRIYCVRVSTPEIVRLSRLPFFSVQFVPITSSTIYRTRKR